MIRYILNRQTIVNKQNILKKSCQYLLNINNKCKIHYKDNKDIEWSHSYEHPLWTKEQLKNIKITHYQPTCISDKITLNLVKIMRSLFDYFAGFKYGIIDENKYLNRIIFLETIAGVPGMVAGMVRHLDSLRTMKKDNGWINVLLEEATNERMHLLSFLEIKKPSFLFRCSVIICQGIFFNSFFLLYLLNPKQCHRFVGYIEEEAVKTYTQLLQDIEDNKLPMFTHLKAPVLAINYWKLSKEAIFKDLILMVRADEANHRIVNHTLANLKSSDINPFSIKKD